MKRLDRYCLYNLRSRDKLFWVSFFWMYAHVENSSFDRFSFTFFIDELSRVVDSSFSKLWLRRCVCVCVCICDEKLERWDKSLFMRFVDISFWIETRSRDADKKSRRWESTIDQANDEENREDEKQRTNFTFINRLYLKMRCEDEESDMRLKIRFSDYRIEFNDYHMWLFFARERVELDFKTSKISTSHQKNFL